MMAHEYTICKVNTYITQIIIPEPEIAHNIREHIITLLASKYW